MKSECSSVVIQAGLSRTNTAPSYGMHNKPLSPSGRAQPSPQTRHVVINLLRRRVSALVISSVGVITGWDPASPTPEQNPQQQSWKNKSKRINVCLCNYSQSTLWWRFHENVTAITFNRAVKTIKGWGGCSSAQTHEDVHIRRHTDLTFPSALLSRTAGRSSELGEHP